MNVMGTNLMSKNVSRYTSASPQKTNISQKVNYSKGINLKMNDTETGKKSITSLGFPDGSTISVFEADNSVKGLTKYDVKYWSNDGGEKTYSVDPSNVDPKDASYIDMLAYSTFLDVSGKTKNAFGIFVSSARGVNGDLEYNSSNIESKQNFKRLIEEFMNQQYKTGNMAGYLSSKQFYDCMK